MLDKTMDPCLAVILAHVLPPSYKATFVIGGIPAAVWLMVEEQDASEFERCTITIARLETPVLQCSDEP